MSIIKIRRGSSMRLISCRIARRKTPTRRRVGRPTTAVASGTATLSLTRARWKCRRSLQLGDVEAFPPVDGLSAVIGLRFLALECFGARVADRIDGPCGSSHAGCVEQAGAAASGALPDP